MRKLLAVAILLVMATVAVADPPPWAPAHGKRAKYEYKYYPGAEVYFDPGRSVYFFLRAGVWVSDPVLPGHLNITLGLPVLLPMDAPDPFRFHASVVSVHPKKAKPARAPGGKSKHRGKGKGKKK